MTQGLVGYFSFWGFPDSDVECFYFQGSKASFSRLRDTEAVSSSQIDSPLSSGVLTNSNHAPSPTDSTSLTSAQTAEYEDFELGKSVDFLYLAWSYPLIEINLVFFDLMRVIRYRSTISNKLLCVLPYGPTKSESNSTDSYQANSIPHSHIGLQHINGEYGSVQAESDSFNCYVPAANPSNQSKPHFS